MRKDLGARLPDRQASSREVVLFHLCPFFLSGSRFKANPDRLCHHSPRAGGTAIRACTSQEHCRHGESIETRVSCKGEGLLEIPRHLSATLLALWKFSCCSDSERNQASQIDD